MGIVCGLVLVSVGAYLAFAYLPEHSPAAARELESQALEGILTLRPGRTLDAYRKSKNMWFIREELYRYFMIAACALLALGAAQIITSALHKDRELVICTVCDGRVAALKKGFGLKCEHCGSMVRYSIASILLGAVLGAIVVIVLMKGVFT